METFQDCVPVCASACEICDQSASTGTVRRGYCSGNNDQDCNIKNSLKFSHDCDKGSESTTQTVPSATLLSAQESGLRHASSASRSVGGSALDNPEISSVLRLCTSSHGIRDSRIILLSVCQAPSESSFDKLRLHKLCTSITLRLLLLRDCMT